MPREATTLLASRASPLSMPFHRKEKTMVTLRDIAHEACVSLATVSKVLNGKESEGRIGPACAKRVCAAAERLGYRPNAAAKATVTGRFDCLGLVKVEGHGIGLGQLPEGLLNGIEHRAAQREQRLIFVNLPPNELGANALPLSLRQAWADGLLLFASWRLTRPALKAINDLRIPTTWIGVHRESDAVYADEADACSQAIGHLLELGHRRIAYVPDPHLEASAQRDRYDVYVQRMSSAGYPPRVVELPGQRRCLEVLPYEQTMEQRRALLAGPDRPTAVIADSSEIAVPLQHTAALLGLQLGRDLSLVTFHDVLVNPLGPTLTTMLLATSEIGSAAVDLLLARVADGGRSAPAVVQRYRLVPGHSTGPAPQS